MKIRKQLFLIPQVTLATLLVFFVGCSSSKYSGATSETTNGVASLVVNEQGVPVVGAEVYLRSREALIHPDSLEELPKAITDEAGKFLIEDVAAGVYTLEVRDTATGKRAVQDSVLVSAQGEVVQKDVLTLQKPGVLVGTLSESDREILGNSYVQVYGLGRAVWVDSVTGGFVITDLPAGTVHIRIMSDTTVLSIKDSFVIKINGTTDAGVYQVGLQKELQIVADLLVANGISLDVSRLMKVVTIEDNHIREINLDVTNLDTLASGNPRISILTPEIGLLRLFSLSLAGNDLTALPEEIGNLVELYYFDVSSNKLASLPDGIGLLVECTVIDIENNDITSLPISVYQLNNLDEIHVNNNRLSNLTNQMKTWIDQHASQNDWADLQRP